MKNKKAEHEGMVLNDRAEPHSANEAMVRTQIYLTRAEHSFLTREAERRGEGMSAVIRSFIDEKMNVPEDAWTNNPLLEPAPTDPEWNGFEDGSLNHDHYAHGAPKKYQKVRGQWVMKAEEAE